MEPYFPKSLSKRSLLLRLDTYSLKFNPTFPTRPEEQIYRQGDYGKGCHLKISLHSPGHRTRSEHYLNAEGEPRPHYPPHHHHLSISKLSQETLNCNKLSLRHRRPYQPEKPC
jgi:hypothetical protein